MRARAVPAYGRLTLLCLKHSRSGAQFRVKLHQWLELARATIADHGAAAIEPVLSYIHQASQLEPDDIAAWAAAISPEAEEINVTSAERLRQEGIAQGMQQGIAQGMQQGIEQGIAQGIVAGEARLLEKQLTRRFGALADDVLVRLRQADSAQLETWASACWMRSRSSRCSGRTERRAGKWTIVS